jgi:hypothetical protein
LGEVRRSSRHLRRQKECVELWQQQSSS